YAGQKIVVTEHEVAGKITRYSYKFNGKVGSLRNSSGFLPQNSYILACRSEEGFIHNQVWFPAGKTLEEEFQFIQGYGKHKQLASVPTKEYQVYSFQADNEGALLVTRKTMI